MTYVVTEDCIRCKYTDCVEVCPVDCFYEGANMLVIEPGECIVCGLCVPECPEEAIVYATDPEGVPWAKLNKEYSAIWPNITSSKAPPKDADAFHGKRGKFKKYFDPESGG